VRKPVFIMGATRRARHHEPMSAAAVTTPLIYIDCDIPEGMTLSAWRRDRNERGLSMAPMSGVLRRVRRARRARRRSESQ
jgi:hypothetical protein